MPPLCCINQPGRRGCWWSGQLSQPGDFGNENLANNRQVLLDSSPLIERFSDMFGDGGGGGGDGGGGGGDGGGATAAVVCQTFGLGPLIRGSFVEPADPTSVEFTSAGGVGLHGVFSLLDGVWIELGPLLGSPVFSEAVSFILRIMLVLPDAKAGAGKTQLEFSSQDAELRVMRASFPSLDDAAVLPAAAEPVTVADGGQLCCWTTTAVRPLCARQAWCSTFARWPGARWTWTCASRT